MISFALDDEQQLIRETLHKFAEAQLRGSQRAHEEAGALSDAVWNQAHELGLALLTLPEAHGGQAASMTTLAICEEELAWGDPAAALALGATRQALHALTLFATPEQLPRLLAPFVASDGAKRACAVAYSERQAGSDGFATSARARGDRHVLDGEKAFVLDRGGADLYLVWAQLDGQSGVDGMALFAVDGHAPGLTRAPGDALLALDAVGHATLTLEGCPAERLAGAADIHATLRRWLAYVAVATAARQVGLLRASYEHALDYTQERKAFGKIVAHFQAVAFNLADLATELEAARGLTWSAAADLDRGQLDGAWSALAHANDAAWRVADDGVQLLGGAGFVRDYPAEKWLRETKAIALCAPPTELASLWAAEAELGHVFVEPVAPTLQPFFT